MAAAPKEADRCLESDTGEAAVLQIHTRLRTRIFTLHVVAIYKCSYLTESGLFKYRFRQIILWNFPKAITDFLCRGHVHIYLLAGASASVAAASFLLPSLFLWWRLPFRKPSLA